MSEVGEARIRAFEAKEVERLRALGYHWHLDANGRAARGDAPETA